MFLENDVLWLWLCEQCSITRVKQHKLLAHFGDVESIYKASLFDLSDTGFLSDADLNLLSKKDLSYAKERMELMAKSSVSLICADNPNYPDMLRTLHVSPTVLYHKGTFTEFNDSFMMAMVGTRNATSYGKTCAYNIAKDLSSCGMVVVSGLAMGIDAKCHEGALAGPSPTVAVVGGGVDIPYPRINAPLMAKIIKNGAVISEYPMGSRPEKFHFPERNRIISGLCRGTIVVEADIKSGSLITASCATEQNRDVFAVPGNINSTTSKGSNYLLKDGAILLTSGKDVASFYGLEIPSRETKAKTNTDGNLSVEDKILCAIGQDTVHTDTICQLSGLDSGTVNANLLILELKGLVIKLAGGYYSKAN